MATASSCNLHRARDPFAGTNTQSMVLGESVQQEWVVLVGMCGQHGANSAEIRIAMAVVATNAELMKTELGPAQ